MTVAELSAVHDRLFGDVQGYTLSSAGRANTELEMDPAFTYGEVTPESVRTVLEFVPHKQGDVFYDLGSGTGKAVIFAAMLGQFGRTVGVEFVEGLHQAAEGVKGRFEAEVRPHLAASQQKTCVEFKQGDLFHLDYSDADVVLAHCVTCFPEELMQAFSRNVEQLKPGAYVVSVTRPLTSQAFQLIKSAPCQMGWGTATLHLYQRL